MKIVMLNDNKFIDEVLQIEQSSFSIPWTRGMFEEEFSKSIAYYVGVLHNEKLIGYGGFWKIFDEGHITNIAVSSAFRRQGVGEKIISEMKNICKRIGVDKMTLEVRKSNLPAISLYEKLGFSVAGLRKAYYEDNKEDALIMWITL